MPVSNVIPTGFPAFETSDGLFSWHDGMEKTTTVSRPQSLGAAKLYATFPSRHTGMSVIAFGDRQVRRDQRSVEADIPIKASLFALRPLSSSQLDKPRGVG